MFNQTINPPEVFLNEDFIGVWDNVIEDDFCDFIKKTLDESTQIIPRSNTSVKDAQLDIAAFNPNIAAHIMCAVRICLEEYLEWYPFLKNFNYHSTTCLFQKTIPTTTHRFSSFFFSIYLFLTNPISLPRIPLYWC